MSESRGVPARSRFGATLRRDAWWIARVFEVHNRVFIAVEQRRIERLGSRMRHPRISKLGIRMEGARDETAEVGGGSCPIEAMVVIQHSYEHGMCDENLPACLNGKRNATARIIQCMMSLKTDFDSNA